jgi:hypothetical protein
MSSTGAHNVTHRPTRGGRTRRRALALTLAAVAAAALPAGCGSSKEVTGGTPGSAKLLKPEDLYKWEGKGRAKTKVGLDIHERKKMRRMAAAKQESP